MLHNELNTQNQNIWKTFLQPLEERAEFGEGTASLFSRLGGMILGQPGLNVRVTPEATVDTALATAVGTSCSHSPGALISDRFFGCGVHLDVNISRMKTRTIPGPSCVDTVGARGFLRACGACRTVQVAVTSLHGQGTLFSLIQIFFCFKVLAPKRVESIPSKQLNTGSLSLFQSLQDRLMITADEFSGD